MTRNLYRRLSLGHWQAQVAPNCLLVAASAEAEGRYWGPGIAVPVQ